MLRRTAGGGGGNGGGREARHTSGDLVSARELDRQQREDGIWAGRGPAPGSSDDEYRGDDLPTPCRCCWNPTGGEDGTGCSDPPCIHSGREERYGVYVCEVCGVWLCMGCRGPTDMPRRCCRHKDVEMWQGQRGQATPQDEGASPGVRMTPAGSQKRDGTTPARGTKRPYEEVEHQGGDPRMRGHIIGLCNVCGDPVPDHPPLGWRLVWGVHGEDPRGVLGWVLQAGARWM